MRRLGIQQTKVASCTRKTGGLYGKTGRLATLSANNAGLLSSQKQCTTRSGSVRTIASRHGVGRLVSMMLRPFAQFAAKITSETNTQRPRLAHGSVVSVCASGKVSRVYDLTVEGTPEFYAGGVLVHNCRYALVPLMKRRSASKVVVRL